MGLYSHQVGGLHLLEEGVAMSKGLSALSKTLSLIRESAGIRGLSEPMPPPSAPYIPDNVRKVCLCVCWSGGSSVQPWDQNYMSCHIGLINAPFGKPSANAA